MWLQVVSTNTGAAKVLRQQKMSQSVLESPKDEAVRATKESKEAMKSAALYCRVSTEAPSWRSRMSFNKSCTETC